jgi:recombination protein RecA
MWGDPRTTPGGLAKNFSYFTRVEVKKDEWLKDGKVTVGQTIKGRTIKNKTYRPQQQAVVDFYFADSGGLHMGDFDTVKDMVNIAIAYEVITRAGAFYSYKDEKWQGKERVLEAIRADLGAQEALRAELMGKIGD